MSLPNITLGYFGPFSFDHAPELYPDLLHNIEQEMIGHLGLGREKFQYGHHFPLHQDGKTECAFDAEIRCRLRPGEVGVLHDINDPVRVAIGEYTSWKSLSIREGRSLRDLLKRRELLGIVEVPERRRREVPAIGIDAVHVPDGPPRVLAHVVETCLEGEIRRIRFVRPDRHLLQEVDVGSFSLDSGPLPLFAGDASAPSKSPAASTKAFDNCLEQRTRFDRRRYPWGYLEVRL